MGIDSTNIPDQVKISTLIPVRHGGESLNRQLQALRRQAQPAADIEVILVDLTPQGQIDPQMNGLPFVLRILPSSGVPFWQALNHAIQEAHGRVCLFLKEGMISEPGLVAAHLQAQRRSDGILGIGKIQYSASQKAGGHARRYAEWKNRSQAELQAGKREPDWRDCSLDNLSVPHSSLLEVGGFTELPEPVIGLDLAFRFVQKGLTCAYLPQATATRMEGRSYQSLATEVESFGSASVRLWQQHPSMLPGLFGHFYRTSPRGVFLRRALLALQVPPLFLAPFGPLLKHRRWAEKWFEFLIDAWFWRGIRRAIPDRATWKRLTQGVIILMFHAFGAQGEPASRYILPQRRFARQIALLKRLGYHVIGLEEYLSCVREFGLPPEKSIVITMDDGYLDNYSLAFPILQQYRFPATIFLITEGMGKTNVWDPGGELAGRPVISWDQAREMQAAGISFGAHTRTHPFLPQIPLEQARREIQGSKEQIEAELGRHDRAFAYPHGVYTPEVQDLVKQAGLLGAVTARVGVNTPSASPFALKRVEVKGTFSLLRFLAILWGTVDAD